MKPKYKYPNVVFEMARNGISQSALAEHLGISRPNIHNRLYGIVEFKADECMIVCKLLNKDFEYLFTPAF